TGGEPLLRKNLPDLIERLANIPGIEDIGLTTNGVMLGRQSEVMYHAGLRRLNLCLDALDPFVFGEMNGRGTNQQIVLKNIELAIEMGIHMKVNMVVINRLHENEILPIETHIKECGITMRYIEFMDVGNDNAWNFDKVLTKKEIYQMLEKEFDLEPVEKDYFGEVAQRYRYKDNEVEVGFITSVSESFCSSCTRARLGSDGKLYTCLFASSGF